MAELIATGTRFVFESTGFTGLVVNAPLTFPGRTAIDTTHLQSTQPGANEIGGRTFIFTKLADPGSFAMTINFNPNEGWPPLHADPEFVRVEFPLPAGLTTVGYIRGQAGATSFDITLNTEELVQGVLTLKAAGVWTIVAPA